MVAHAHPHADPPDTVGQILSVVCAVHCVSTPLFFAMAPAAASVLGGAHPILLAFVVVVAGWSFVPGYRCHRSRVVLGLAAAGIGALALAAFVFGDQWVLDTALSLVGSAFMMAAHWRNRQLLRRAHAH